MPVTTIAKWVVRLGAREQTGDTKAFKAVVQVKDQDEAEHAWRLAAAHEGVHVLVVRQLRDGSPAEGETVRMAPGNVGGGAILLRRAALSSIVGEPPTFKLVARNTTVVPENHETYVVRISAEERYSPK